MDFLDLVNRITLTKQLPQEPVGSIMIPIKRFLSTDQRLTKLLADVDMYYYTLGPERFLKLLMTRIPRRRYYCKNPKKTESKADEWLNNKLRIFFHCSNAELPSVRAILKAHGLDVKELRKFFGYNRRRK